MSWAWKWNKAELGLGKRMETPRAADEEEVSGVGTRWLSALNAKEQDVDITAQMAGSHEKLPIEACS